jgi:lysophospholipase L1-like esterase
MNMGLKILLGVLLFLLAAGLLLFYFGGPWIKGLVHKKVIFPRHQQLKSMFEACPTTTGAIVFVGNSITEGGNWAELFPEKTILNRGIGGDISGGVLARMDEIIRHQPSKLFIAIGTNDLAIEKSNAEIMANYRAIIQKVQVESPDTKIYVQSVLPVGKHVVFGHDNKKIPPLNNDIKQMCEELQLTYIDLQPTFADSEGYLDKKFSNDNLHLLGAGYLAWKDVIEPMVME